MKLFAAIFLLTTSLYAQEVIMGAPLSVDEEPGRPLKTQQDQPIGAIVPAEAVINPNDGQIKLDKAETTTNADEKKEQSAEAKVIENLAVHQASTPFIPQKYLQFGFGYLDSKWEKAHNSLDNGSVLTSFKVASDMNKKVQVGFAVEIMNDTSDQTMPDNVRVLQYRLFADYHAPIFAERLHWVAGLALSIGDYSIRRLSLNAQGEEVNTKIKAGTIYGLIPAAGIRFYLVDQNSFDIMVEYHQYFSTPQRYISGLALAPRFSFLF